jgi:hypothetical protein
MRFSFRSCLVIAGAASLAACVNGTATEATTGPFYSIALSVADSTSFPAGSIVSVRATVTHQAAAVAAAAVGWAVKTGDTTAKVKTTTTDTLGQTSFLWVLADTAGLNTLVVASGDRADTLHIIGAVGKPVYILAVGADSVTGSVGVTVTLQARVTDGVGNNVVGTAVNWTTTGGPSQPATIPTGAGGISQIGYSYPTAGTYFVTAELPGQGTHIFTIVVH